MGTIAKKRTEGLTEKGKFAPGNKLGRGGHDMAKRASQIRLMLLREFTPERQKKVCDKLIKQAESGDMVAIRELLDRTAGKPITPVEIDGHAAFVISPIIRENIVIEVQK
jgi:hypothetical protein